MKTVAAYIRVSTEDQIEYSPDSQLKAIQKYAKSNDMILPQEFVFVDEGISGRKAEKRPSFMRMISIAKMKPTPFDDILVWKFSRFARNREDSIVYKSMLRKQCGIDVISISEQIGEDKTSILIEALLEAMDEYYSINLAEEVKRGMTEKFSRGGVVSQPPFGYKMGGKIYVPDETNAPIVQMIFNDYLDGITVRQIAANLNDMGLRTSKGNPFENRTIEYILTNPVYTGKLRRSKNGRDNLDRFHQSTDNTMIVEGEHESIISEDIFNAAQAKKAETKRIYKRYSRQEPAQYMLKGLVRCDKCGSTLIALSNKTSIQCHQYAKGACNVSHCISIIKANKIIIQKLKSDLSSQNFNLKINAPKPYINSKNDTYSVLIDKEYKKLERIKEAYEAGIDTLSEYKENKIKIQSKIKELESLVETNTPRTEAEIKQELSDRIRSGLEIIQNEDASESLKNKVLRSIVNEIIYIKPQDILEIHYNY